VLTSVCETVLDYYNKSESLCTIWSGHESGVAEIEEGKK
jgi:hypothetical protein